ncbi:transmembrane protease serine [Holotrichia oblita]|uniref:Transmembrane protease serine n=1 Tax=Holotrichia oblita TaxID=644536 RepID=A0ACB9TPI8_HOLOL|nr:transmembrane protease serine [Holotrichia oblita]
MNTIHSGILAFVLSVFLITATDPPQETNPGAISHLGQSLYQTGNIFKLALTKVESEPLKHLHSEEVENLKNISGESNTEPLADYVVGDKYNTSGKPQDLSGYDIIGTISFSPQESKSDYEKLLERDFVKPLLELYKNGANHSLINISSIHHENDTRDLTTDENAYLVHTLNEEDFDKLHLEFSKVFNINEEKTDDYKDSIRRKDENGDHLESNETAHNKTELLQPNSELKTVLQDVGFNQIYLLTKGDFQGLMKNSKMLDIVYDNEFQPDQTSVDIEKSTATSTEEIPQSRISKEDNVDDMKQLTKEDLDILENHPAIYQNPFDTMEKGIHENIEESEVKYKQNEKRDLISEATVTSIRRDDNGLFDVNPKDEHIGEILPANYDITQDKFILESQQSPTRRRNHLIYSDSTGVPRSSYDFGDMYRYSEPNRFKKIRFRPDFSGSGLGTDIFEPMPFSDDQSYRYRDQREYPTSDESRMYVRPSRYSYVPLHASANFPQKQRFRDSFYESKEKDTQVNWRGLGGYGRRPRVIFPSDLVAFRENNQEEQDYLAGDSNLQDIQQQDTRDRGLHVIQVLAAQLIGKFNPKDIRSERLLRVGASLSNINDYLRVTCVVDQVYIIGNPSGCENEIICACLRRCGGSLVSRRHVVTAGHCVARATPRQVHVTLGDYVINSAVEPLPAYTFGVSQIQVHPFFKFTPQADRFDVAVLRLDRTAHQLPHIAPICLPPKGESFLGEIGVAAGWGAMSPGSRLRPQTLQAVKVPVLDSRLCERWHRSKGIGVVIHEEMLCAGYKNGGRDSCQGDSGGPLMLQKQARWYLIGIVSAGYSCAQAGQPGIYHRVAHTVDWITRAIGS